MGHSGVTVGLEHPDPYHGVVAWYARVPVPPLPGYPPTVPTTYRATPSAHSGVSEARDGFTRLL